GDARARARALRGLDHGRGGEGRSAARPLSRQCRNQGTLRGGEEEVRAGAHDTVLSALKGAEASLGPDEFTPPSAGRVVTHETETQIGWGRADGAAAGTGVADEVGHVGAVAALDDADTAVDDGRGAVGIKFHVAIAGVGPFGDRAGEAEKPVLIGAAR